MGEDSLPIDSHFQKKCKKMEKENVVWGRLGRGSNE
jgi:hypothetical protein